MLDSDLDKLRPITTYEMVAYTYGSRWAQVWQAWRGHDYHRVVYFGPAIPRIVRRLREVRSQNEFLRTLGGNVAAAFELEARGRALLESGEFANLGGKYLPEGVTDEALRGAAQLGKDEHGMYL